ncbi:hypothetical protein BO82DRAFT_119340 [Aspergillus uvarum CBS 121591]|uniref:Transmembrane protein n=1 Tax=Aspergillus uvarum CBS 121591 TaxID=1448315 RepID=A0A319C7G2_9EURO|nr:hypothetical protein BO82DRAFT_119340 [Aspergillus uvarum CBS 121591]PYH80000.1 hypothetical protein BO82DRAFT_119340 [Aspergillus uvarum CBS 121591]
MINTSPQDNGPVVSSYRAKRGSCALACFVFMKGERGKGGRRCEWAAPGNRFNLYCMYGVQVGLIWIWMDVVLTIYFVLRRVIGIPDSVLRECRSIVAAVAVAVPVVVVDDVTCTVD